MNITSLMSKISDTKQLIPIKLKKQNKNQPQLIYVVLDQNSGHPWGTGNVRSKNGVQGSSTYW